MSLPDMRHQLAALILAEELNFTRAAERLKITQPALSKQIIELEKRLGFSVFLRDQKKVELTESGQVFIRGCKDARALLEKSIRLARTVKDEIQPVVTVGHSPFVDPSLVSAVLSVHLPLYPSLRLRMESMFAMELAHSVLSAELDLAIIGEPSPNPLLTLVPLTTDPLYVLMPKDHTAAYQRDVAINDLARVGWVVFPRRANPVIYDRVLESGEKAQVKPVELHHYMASQEAVQLISENFGIAFMPRGLAEQIRHPEIIARPLRSDALQVTSHLVLRADQSSRLVNEFGRAFIRKAISNPKIAEVSGKMLLKL